MKIYIAASYPRKLDALVLGAKLIAYGHIVVSGWVFEDEGYSDDQNKFERMQDASIRDFKDVRECDLLVCLTDGENQLTHGGRHTELGIALALGKRVVVIGELEQVFHYYPCMRRLTIEELLDEIK